MKTTLTKNPLSLAVTFTLALGFSSSAALAQNFGPAKERELWTAAPVQIWKNGYNECWHSAFGPPPPANECDPAPIAQAPAPAPAPYVPVAVVAPQPVYENLTLNANVLFDFDKSVLRQAGRDSLDDFVTRIKGITPGTITAVGYADRFGSDGYNQALSERRVATVKAYLIDKGVESKWVNSSGEGELRPTTKAGECTGATANASTIACLQPDRHVFVQVSGSRLKQ